MNPIWAGVIAVYVRRHRRVEPRVGQTSHNLCLAGQLRERR